MRQRVRRWHVQRVLPLGRERRLLRWLPRTSHAIEDALRRVERGLEVGEM